MEALRSMAVFAQLEGTAIDELFDKAQQRSGGQFERPGRRGLKVGVHYFISLR